MGPGAPGGGAPAWGNFANFSGHGGPRISKLKIFGAIGGALAIAALSVAGYFLKDKFLGKKAPRGTITYRHLGIDDPERAQPDQVIGALEAQARKRWKRDATWWSINLTGVRPDGTIDLTGSSGNIKFVSPEGVRSGSPRQRKDSIKPYSLTASGARSTQRMGVKKRVEGFEPLPVPGCKLADLGAVLRERGFSTGTVRISFDPRFGFASGWAWRVWSDDAQLAGYYSMDDCGFTKKPPG